MGILDDLKDLERLREFGQRGPNPSALEQEFLALSFHSPKPALTVREPKLYHIEGEERTHTAAALTSLGITTVPDAIDISGGFAGMPADAVLFLAPSQLQADHSTRTRAYLPPLIEQVYSASRFLTDFTLHEVLAGTVVPKRGDLDLREVHLFPERFISGPYELTLSLETPAKTVQQFQRLDTLLRTLTAKPKERMLDPARVQEITELAVGLRQRLGALSRYQSPPGTFFRASVNSCVVQLPDTLLFFLYGKQNAVVHFGPTPFRSDPRNLTVLSGDDGQHTLAELVAMGIYKPSQPVVVKRGADFAAASDQAIRAGASVPAGYRTIAEGLTDTQTYFAEARNPQLRKNYALQHPELLEFLVCPASDDAVVHDLLPRLSQQPGMRRYHHTPTFIAQFTAADEPQRAAFLQEVAANLLFNNQQNNDVNVWLYQNHRAFSEASGITFAVPARP